MSERLVKWRLFFVWEEDKEERWLEEMASQGWHLIHGGLRFVFERGEPAQIRYRLDYRRRFPQGEGEYFTMYRDAGWEHICDFKQWHYFRSPAATGAPDIYTDIESRVEMYRQIQRALVIVLGVNVMLISTILRHSTPWIMPLLAAIMLLLTYGVVRLRLRINNLRATGAR
jgi:hypothetical protein